MQDTTTGGASVSHYRAKRGTSPSSLSVIAEPSDISYVDTSVTPNTTYYYAVLAVNNVDVEGAQSTQVTGSVAQPTASGVTTTANDMKSVTVAWTGSASKYEVHRGPPGFTPSTSNLVATVTSTSYSDSPTNTFVTDAQIGLSGLISRPARRPPASNSSRSTRPPFRRRGQGWRGRTDAAGAVRPA